MGNPYERETVQHQKASREQKPKRGRGGCIGLVVGAVGAIATIGGLMTFFLLDVPEIAERFGFIEPTPTATFPPTLAPTDTAEPPAPLPTDTPAPTATPPHAPEFSGNVQNTMTMLIDIPAGGEATVNGGDLYEEVKVPTAPPVSCIDAEVLAYSWQVREPYPNTGELLIQYPLMGTRQELGFGESGSGLAGPCTEFIFTNQSLDDYRVELRYGANLDAFE